MIKQNLKTGDTIVLRSGSSYTVLKEFNVAISDVDAVDLNRIKDDLTGCDEMEDILIVKRPRSSKDFGWNAGKQELIYVRPTVKRISYNEAKAVLDKCFGADTIVD